MKVGRGSESKAMKKTKDQLRVYMFGGFSMEFNGRRLGENFRGNSQIALLLQTILHHRKEGAGRDLLVQTLFGGQELKDVSHSLRNVMYNTHKKLRELGLPELDYFYKEKNTYYWTGEIEVIEDAEEFEQTFYQAMKEQEDEKKLEKMAAAARLYTGSFLRGEENANWIIKEADRLKGLFARCMWEIDMPASRLRRFSQLRELSRHAAQADPFTNWEALELKALVGLEHFEDAEKLYNETVKKYTEQFGRPSAKQVRDLERELGQYMMYQQVDIAGVQERLKMREDSGQGGFFCPFPIFRELYRSVERVMVRFGGYIYLILCTLTEEGGASPAPSQAGEKEEGTASPAPSKAGEKEDTFEQISELFMETIIHTVRHSDTITRYGKGQYLILLFGTSEENCSLVTERIDAGFAKALEEIGESLQGAAAETVPAPEGTAANTSPTPEGKRENGADSSSGKAVKEIAESITGTSRGESAGEEAAAEKKHSGRACYAVSYSISKVISEGPGNFPFFENVRQGEEPADA